MRKTVASVLCFLLVAVSLPVSVSAAKPVELPQSLTPPQCAYVQETDTDLLVVYAQPRDALELSMNIALGHFSDGQGGNTAADHWWTPYGVDYRFFDFTAQVDWCIDNGDWHHDPSWDTAIYPSGQCWRNGMVNPDTDRQNLARVLGKFDESLSDEDSALYPYRNCFVRQENTSGELCNYFDIDNHSIRFRLRYAVEVELPSNEIALIFSDWSEPAVYGTGRNFVEIPQSITAVPDISGYSIDPTGGVNSTPKIVLTDFAPSGLVVLDSIRESKDDNRFRLDACVLSVEYSLDPEDFSSVGGRNIGLSGSPQVNINLYDIWNECVRGLDNTFWWDGSPVYMRAKYVFVAEIASDNGQSGYTSCTVSGEYSEPVCVSLPKVNKYLISINHSGPGYGGNGKQSFSVTQGHSLGWMHYDVARGCYVDTIYVDDKIAYDRDDPLTFGLLEWDGCDFRLRGVADIPTKDITISIAYGGHPTATYRLQVTKNSTGGDVYPDEYESYDDDGYYVYGDDEVTAYVRSDRGYIIDLLCIDGDRIDSAKGTMEFGYCFGVFFEDHEMKVSYRLNYGDANLDKYIDVRDASFIQKVSAKIEQVPELQESLADVNGDSAVNIKDATLVQKYAAMLIVSFPAVNK